MRGPLDIHQYLLAHDVHHEIVRLPRNSPSNASLAQALGLPERRCVAVHPFQALTTSSDTLTLLLAPSDTEVDDALVGQRLARTIPRADSRDVVTVRRAGADVVSSRTDYLAGHVAPLLLPPDVAVVALQPLADLATTVVYTPTGDVGTALGLRALDLLVLSHATVRPLGERATRRRPIRIDLEPKTGEPPLRVVSAQRAPSRRAAASVTPVAS
jgi:hypothetical protein